MTGAAGVGDPWPAVALARLHVEAGRPGMAVTPPLALSVARVDPALTPNAHAAHRSDRTAAWLRAASRRRPTVITFAQDAGQRGSRRASATAGHGSPTPARPSRCRSDLGREPVPDDTDATNVCTPALTAGYRWVWFTTLLLATFAGVARGGPPESAKVAVAVSRSALTVPAAVASTCAAKRTFIHDPLLACGNGSQVRSSGAVSVRSDRAALKGGAQVGEHDLVPARGFKAARLIVEALCGGEAGMAEHVAGIGHMLWVLDGDRGGGGIAEPMWR